MGKPDPIKMEVPVAFVVLSSGYDPTDQLANDIKKHVAKSMGPIARPESIVFVSSLPKTRSGKIMRRLLKAVILGRPLGDVTTLEDAASIEAIEKAYMEFKRALEKA